MCVHFGGVWFFGDAVVINEFRDFVSPSNYEENFQKNTVFNNVPLLVS